MSRRAYLEREIEHIDTVEFPKLEEARGKLLEALALHNDRGATLRIFREILGEAYDALPAEDIEESSNVVPFEEPPAEGGPVDDAA